MEDKLENSRSPDITIEPVKNEPSNKIIDITDVDIFGTNYPNFLTVKLTFDRHLKIAARKILVYEESPISIISEYARNFLKTQNSAVKVTSRTSLFIMTTKATLLTPNLLVLEVYKQYHKIKKNRLKLEICVENTFGGLN